MQTGHQVTSSTSLQIPPQPDTAVLTNQHAVFLVQAIINPNRDMDGLARTPQPPKTCSSPGHAGTSCWSLDLRVTMLLLTLAGALILLLLYRLLQLRHRLTMARARHALEYNSFFHSATYTLKHPTLCEDPPAKNGTVPEAAPPISTITPITPSVVTPFPPPPVTSPPSLPLPTPPPPPHPPPSLPPTPPVSAFPLTLPVIHTTPPSPHMSWGACSDVDVYSRIGAFRPSRLSSLSTQSKVILFEHSSL
ncbi:uncharacterized protein V6R79_016417 [Siganus canaliculatus]